MYCLPPCATKNRFFSILSSPFLDKIRQSSSRDRLCKLRHKYVIITTPIRHNSCHYYLITTYWGLYTCRSEFGNYLKGGLNGCVTSDTLAVSVLSLWPQSVVTWMWHGCDIDVTQPPRYWPSFSFWPHKAVRGNRDKFPVRLASKVWSGTVRAVCTRGINYDTNTYGKLAVND